MADTDDYALETIPQAHAINASLFIPFVIHRLNDRSGMCEALLTVRLGGPSEADQRRRLLRLRWSPSSIPVAPFGVGASTVTEWAALGVACVVSAVYGGLRLRAVSGRGERFDYWLTRGSTEYGLEVSGTVTEDVEGRHRAKVRQLRDNPYGVDGFVVVVGFTTREVLFTYHRIAEEP